MAVNPSPFGPKPQFELSDGTPAVGNQLFFYVAGSVNTKQNTYTDSTGGSANTNPLVLNALGEPTTEIWFTAGQSYKVVYAPSTDTDPPTSPIWTIDNLRGINDTSVTIDQWVSSGITPTFVSATSFTLPGDQTTAFHPSRMLQSTNTGGTVYSVIVSSVFAALTTVTVVNFSGAVLDSGLSAVSYSLITAVNPSINADMVNRKAVAVASAATTNIWSTAGDFVHVTGNTGPITSLGTAPYAGAERTVIFDSTPTLTHNATTLILPGAANITTAANDRMTVRADTTANMIVTSYTKADGTAVVATIVSAASQAEVDAGTVSNKYIPPSLRKISILATQATTSGTSKDFTIPAGAREITITLNGVSTNGTSLLMLQLGDAGGIETSGYISRGGNNTANSNATTGMLLNATGGAGQTLYGSFKINLEDAATFAWAGFGACSDGSGTVNEWYAMSGTKSLSAELTTVRITAVNGTDAFDAGVVGCSYIL